MQRRKTLTGYGVPPGQNRIILVNLGLWEYYQLCGKLLRTEVGLLGATAMAINLEDAYGAAEAAAAFHRLSLLDQLWTNSLAERRELSAQEIDVLARLSREMEAVLSDAAAHARRLRDLAETAPEDLDQSYQELLTNDRIDERQRSFLQSKVEQAGGLAQFAINSFRIVEQHASVEQEALRQKRDVLLSGNYSPGDLSRDFSCSTYSSGVVAGAILFGVNPLAGALVAGVSLAFAAYYEC